MSNPQGEFTWDELLTTDIESVQNFYQNVVGWNIEPSGIEGMDYRLLNAGEIQVAGMMQLSDDMLAQGAPAGGIMPAGPNGPSPMWRFYFRVANIHEAAKAIETNGGAVIHPPQEVPGNDEILIGVDPQAAQFALVAAKT